MIEAEHMESPETLLFEIKSQLVKIMINDEALVYLGLIHLPVIIPGM